MAGLGREEGNMTDAATTQQFIAALQALERERDLEPICGLFAPDSHVGNVVFPRHFAGPAGARTF
jgi:hypothetical protein